MDLSPFTHISFNHEAIQFPLQGNFFLPVAGYHATEIRQRSITLCNNKFFYYIHNKYDK